MLLSRLRWLSIAARGGPAVPLVNSSAARWSGSTSTTGIGSARRSSLSSTVTPVTVVRVALGLDHRPDRRERGAVDRGPARSRSGADDDGDGLDDGQLLLELGARARRVERHRDGAEADDREVRHDEVPVVAAQDGDAITRSDAEAGQPAAHPGHLVAQVAIGRLAVSRDQRDDIVRVTVEHRRDVHPSSPTASIVARWSSARSEPDQRDHTGDEDRCEEQAERERGGGTHGPQATGPAVAGRARPVSPGRAARRAARVSPGRPPRAQLVGGRPLIERDGEHAVRVEDEPDGPRREAAKLAERTARRTSGPCGSVGVAMRSWRWSPQLAGRSSGPTFSCALPNRSTHRTSATIESPSSRGSGTVPAAAGRDRPRARAR
jgi:hypothetical protein